MIIAAVLGVLFLGYEIRVVTVPMLLALALAYLFEPLVRWLRARRICSRRAAALGIIALSFFIIIVPLTFGAGFAVVQGARAAGDIATGVSRVQKSLEKPDDAALRGQITEGAWLSIRDYLARKTASKDAPAPPIPGAIPAPASGADHAPPPSVIERITDGEEAKELGARAIGWLNEHAGELAAALGRRVAGSGADAARAAFTTATTIGTLVLQAVLTAVFFYFLSTSWAGVLEFWESFIPQAQRPRAMEILGKMDHAIAGFVRGRVTIVLIEIVLITLLYFLAGVPMPLLLGPMVGMLFIVPYMNTLGIPIAVLLMWLQGVQGPIVAPHLFAGSGGLWWILLAPPAIHFIGHALDDYFLNPLIQGKHTDLAIPTIVFSSIAGGALAGVYGLLLAIPVAACLRILMKEVFWPRLEKWVRGEAKDLLPIGRE
jgi:predicted PurR-regulated permease PerM